MIRSSQTAISPADAPWSAATAAALVLGGLLAACAAPTYVTQRSEPLSAQESQPPPPGQARLVAGHDGGLLTTVRYQFSCLDGKSTFSFLSFDGYPRELVVAPGRHYVTLKVFIRGGTGAELMWLDALPNHVYEVRTEARVAPTVLGLPTHTGGERFLAVMVDRAMNKAVGGITGGQPPTPNDPPKCGP